MDHLDESITIGEKYSPTMHIGSKTGARDYLRRLVDHCRRHLRPNFTVLQATEFELKALRHYSRQYFSADVQARVADLFGATDADLERLRTEIAAEEAAAADLGISPPAPKK